MVLKFCLLHTFSMILWTICGKKTIQDNVNALATDVCALAFDYKVEFELYVLLTFRWTFMRVSQLGNEIYNDQNLQLNKTEVIENMYQLRIGIRSLTVNN